MILRTLVASFLRQTAQRKIYEAVSRSQGDDLKSDQKDDGNATGERFPEETPPCDVAFVFALGIESGGLVDLLPESVTSRCHSFTEHVAHLKGRRIVVVESGVGIEAAARATADLISLHKPKWIVSAGFAGGLCDELVRGHILMADTVIDCRGNQLSVGLKFEGDVIQATKGLHVGRLLTVDNLIRTEEKKRALAERHHALACDMETMAVAEACTREKVRFLSVRIISDAVNDTLPPEIEELLNQKSLAGKIGAATGAIFKRPASIKEMWKLKEDALIASDRLAKYLLGVLPQLTDDTDAVKP